MIFLQLHECGFDPQDQQFGTVTRPVKGLLQNFDVTCLLYDQSDRTSFQSAAQIFVSCQYELVTSIIHTCICLNT